MPPVRYLRHRSGFTADVGKHGGQDRGKGKGKSKTGNLG